jgi:hypothetical protein
MAEFSANDPISVESWARRPILALISGNLQSSRFISRVAPIDLIK